MGKLHSFSFFNSIGGSRQDTPGVICSANLHEVLVTCNYMANRSLAQCDSILASYRRFELFGLWISGVSQCNVT